MRCITDQGGREGTLQEEECGLGLAGPRAPGGDPLPHNHYHFLSRFHLTAGEGEMFSVSFLSQMQVMSDQICFQPVFEFMNIFKI